MQGIGQGFESPHLHQTFEEVSEVNGDIQVGKVLERGPKKNVDNRIQYVGQIEEKENSKEKNQSQDIIE